MASAALIIAAVVVGAIVIFGIIVFMVYMQHPEDKFQAWGSKFIVLIGLFLACSTILLLPFDAALRGGPDYSSMGTLWFVAYISIGCFSFVICPFAMSWYETDEDESFIRRILTAICWCSVFTFVFAVLTAILYSTIGYVQLPVLVVASPMIPYNQVVTYTAGDGAGETSVSANSTFSDMTCLVGCSFDTTLKLRTTAVIYILAMLSFFGWFLVMVFGGIGMFSLPMDLINAFRCRPKPIDVREFAEMKLTLHTKAAQLVAVAKEKQAEFKAKPSTRKYKIFCNKLKGELFMVEEDLERMKICFEQRGGNPLIPFFKLVLGVFCIAISLSWIIQIILVIFLHECSGKCVFLNQVFIQLNNAFPLFGTVAYGCFAFYLFGAVVKGAMKFGMRFLIISIHPLKVGGTMMNSMLFNVSILLLCSAAIVQICTTAFQDYVRLTAISQIFVSQVQYLIFLEYFFQKNIFYIVFVIFSLLALIFGLVEPCFRKKGPINLEEAMHRVDLGRKSR